MRDGAWGTVVGPGVGAWGGGRGAGRDRAQWLDGVELCSPYKTPTPTTSTTPTTSGNPFQRHAFDVATTGSQ